MIISRTKNGFTLIELITVIAIILILMGLLFPAIGGIKDSAKKVQAKNDITNIVTAVKAYYTEYGKYPVVSALVSGTSNTTFGGTAKTNTNDLLFNILRVNSSAWTADEAAMNPRLIVFIEVPTTKNTDAPKAGISSKDNQFYDPWGKPYNICIDTGYANQIVNPYADAPGGAQIGTGVVVWSFGKDGVQGTKGGNANYQGSDDVISWQ